MKQMFVMLILTLVSHLSFAEAGHEVGTGSDYVDIDNQSAWFLGTSPVRYCIEIDDTLSKHKKTLPKFVARAISEWTTLIKKDVNIKDPFLSPLNIATTFTEIPRCEADTELVIYFGMKNARVKEQQGKFKNPTAFTYREKYDLHTHRSHGFIWISGENEVGPNFPKWNIEMSLYGIVLHEFGHIFGCGHFEDTIMTDQLQDWLVETPKNKDIRKKFLSTIGLENRIIFPKDVVLTGKISANKNDEEDVFRDILGRAPIGKIHAALTLWFGADSFNALKALRVGFESSTIYQLLTIGDDQDSIKLRIEITSTTPLNQSSDALLFKRAGFTEIYDKIPLAISAIDRSMIIQGFIKTHNGSLRQVTLYINAKRNGKSVVIDYFSPEISQSGELKTLFEY